jgi:hypothetical protein
MECNCSKDEYGTEYKLMLRDSFEEVDDPNGHLKKKLTITNFRKMEFPITSLY